MLVTFFVGVIFAFAPIKAYALTSVPNFPSCANPQGQTKVVYQTGTHGIVGDQNTYTGSDAVYTLSDQTLTQCFCSVDGKGIQTNWWKTSSITQDEIDVLKNLGWILVPDGTLWGLDEGTYMAKNTTYACGSTTTTSSNGEVQGTSSTSSNNSSSNNSGRVLGLATTGSEQIIALWGILAGASLLLSKRLLSEK